MIETGIIIAAIVGLVEVVKAFGLNSHFAPALSVALGVLFAFGVAVEATVGLTVFNGILYGLMASGLYSGTRASVGIK